MKKITFWKSFFLLFALIVGSSSAWAEDYEKYSGTITEGDYLIVYENGAMKAAVSSDRFEYTTVNPSNDIVSNPAADIVWHVAASGNYWTIYNADVSKYAASTGAKNKAQLLTSGTDDMSLWTVTGTSTYEFVNKKNNANNVNKNLRKNGTYGFACYATSTGGALTLYKKKAANATALEVKTAPSKVNYKVGETLDLTGLVLDATVGGNHVDVTSGYTAKIGETTVTSGTTALNAVGAQTITFTYGGQTTTQTIHVCALQSIALTTTGVKTEYNAGQSFDPTNLVVKATFSDEETTATEWEETIAAADYTYSPDGALATTDTKVTISYTWGEIDKTADIDITVNAATAYTVTFNAGTGSCATASLTEATGLAGVTLPTATISVTGWNFAGWAEAATTNTEVAPTLYAAGATYHPVDNVTLYAVYSYPETSSSVYTRVTTVEAVTGASKVVIIDGRNNKLLNSALTTVTGPTETDGKITNVADNAIFTLAGNNTDGFTLTNSEKTLGIDEENAEAKMSNTDNLWIFELSEASGYNGYLVLTNKGLTNATLEYNNSSTVKKWTTPVTSNYLSNNYFVLKIYIPETTTVYNSSPVAIVNPSIAFETTGNKSLYLKNTNIYTNVANVTGIDKTVTYTSSDATVASVSDAGVVTALKVGTTTITARVEKEIGVNTEATSSYIVTVKDASDVSGLKLIATSTTATPFTADLTDAVVTYVKGNYAYIQDASSAIYLNYENHGLVAGTKINGAVSGSVKVTNQIDQITALDLTNASVTDDGVVPAPSVITLATLAANKSDYEGKFVKIEGAKVTSALNNGSASGGKINDSSNSETNLYAPDSDIEVLKDAEGNFTGIISLYNGSTIRFNIYDQDWIVLTKNAPTAQTLTFAEDEVVLDEETDAYTAFVGQTVSGAQGTVTYALTGDAIGAVNAETGVITLNGTCGTATVTATAAAIEVTEGGVTTPYTATNKSYTITVRPRWTVTFNILGTNVLRREASFEAGVTAPEVETYGDNVFLGWTNAAIDTPTDDAPATIITDNDFDGLTGDATYYALFGKEKSAGFSGSYTLDYDEETDLQAESLGYGNAINYTAADGSAWVIKAYKNNGLQINTGKNATIKVPTCPGDITTIELTCSVAANFGFSSSDYTGSGTISYLATPTNKVLTLSGSSVNTGYIVPRTGSNIIYKIIVNYAIPTTYNQYTTNPTDKTNIIMEDADGNKVAESIDLSAMTDATALVGVHADEITYTRTMGKLSTLYLPYASTIPDGMTAYEFNGINDAGTALNFNVVEGTTLNAYTPYVLEQEASASKTLSATNVDIAADTNGKIVKGEWTLMGTIARIENADLLAAAGTGTPYVVQSDKKWHPVQTNAAVYIPAFRAYFIASEASGARIMEMNLGGETTSIDKLDVIDDLDDNTPIFNLAGQKITKAYKGVVIQNGKKVVRK